MSVTVMRSPSTCQQRELLQYLSNDEKVKFVPFSAVMTLKNGASLSSNAGPQSSQKMEVYIIHVLIVILK